MNIENYKPSKKVRLIVNVHNQVTRTFQCSLVDIKGTTNTKDALYARHMMNYVFRYKCKMKVKDIGLIMNCHHSSVSYSCKVISNLLSYDHLLLEKKKAIFHELKKASTIHD